MSNKMEFIISMKILSCYDHDKIAIIITSNAQVQREYGICDAFDFAWFLNIHSKVFERKLCVDHIITSSATGMRKILSESRSPLL